MRRETGDERGLESVPPVGPLEKNGFHNGAAPNGTGVPRRRGPRFLWGRMLGLPLVAALCCGLTAFLVTTYGMTRWYQAGATLYFNTPGGGSAASLFQQMTGGAAGGGDPAVGLDGNLYTSPMIGASPNMAMSVMATGRVQSYVMKQLHLAQRWHLSPGDAVKRLNSNVSYGMDRNGFLLVQAMDTDPKLAVKIVNSYVEAMRSVSTDLSVYYARHNRLALQDRLSELKSRLNKEQAELLSIQTKSVRSLPLGKGSVEAYAALEAQQRQTQIELDSTDAEIRQRQASASATSGDALNLPTQLPFAQHANENLRDLERQFASVSAVYGPDYPQYQQLQEQVEQARAQVQAEVRREVSAVRKGISPEMAALYATQAKLRAQLSGIQEASVPMRTALVTQPTLDMREAQLMTDMTLNQKLVEGMTLDVERAQEAEERNVPRFNVIDAASPPSIPALPRVLFTTVFATIAGFLLGLAWLVGRSAIRQSVVQDTLARIADEYGMIESSGSDLDPLQSPNYRQIADQKRSLVEVSPPEVKRMSGSAPSTKPGDHE